MAHVPEHRLALLNKTQADAVAAWLDAGGIGTLRMAVGLGKTITAFKCVYALLDAGHIRRGDTVRFMAETNAREITLYEDEMPKFKELYGKDLREDFDFRFECYQGMRPADDVVLDILDEIHDTLSEKYFVNVRESAAKYRIGLTGAMSENSNVFRSQVTEELQGKVYQGRRATQSGKITEMITKGEMLQVLCPVVYEKTLSTAISEGLLSPFETTIVTHQMDDTVPYKKMWARSNRPTTERKWYDARQSIMMDYNRPNSMKRNMGRAMAQMLYSLPSKIAPAKVLIESLEGKTVVFGKYLNYLDHIVGKENVVRSLDVIREFNKGERRVIGSVRKIKQGITLEGVENLVIVAYDSKPHNLEQMIGRVVRFVAGKRARVFIFVTQGSLEVKWHRRQQEIRDAQNRVVRKLDLNVTRYLDSRQILLGTGELN